MAKKSKPAKTATSKSKKKSKSKPKRTPLAKGGSKAKKAMKELPAGAATMPPAAVVKPRVITQQMIALRAYEIWEKKHRSHHTNHENQNWLEAEAQLRAGK